MRVAFLGAPGSGKGTQAQLFCSAKGLAHISTGEMLRQTSSQDSEIGRRIHSLIDVGLFVPDFLMIDLIQARIMEPDCAQGYLLDGFPRTVPQAEALAQMLEEDGRRLSNVILFDLSEEELLRRLAHRREIESRSDDCEATQQKRLEIYKEQTLPLIDYYAREGLLVRIEASGSIEEVQSRLLASLCGDNSVR